jgi:hypothetical protein
MKLKGGYSQQKEEHYEILREYYLLQKIWDPEYYEEISLEDSQNFVMGEVLRSPIHVSPPLKEILRGFLE